MNLRSILGLSLVHSRWKILALLNALFFGCVFIVLALASLFLAPPLYFGTHLNVPYFFLDSSWFVMILVIFTFNLALGSFVFVTLPGIVFFPLSAGILLYRGFLWGLLLYASPVWLFAVSLPTVMLEGEAYVFAAAAGTIAGASWVRPVLVYQKDGLSRVQALKISLKECLRIYAFVVALLLVAAIVETATILLLIPALSR